MKPLSFRIRMLGLVLITVVGGFFINFFSHTKQFAEQATSAEMEGYGWKCTSAGLEYACLFVGVLWFLGSASDHPKTTRDSSRTDTGADSSSSSAAGGDGADGDGGGGD